MTLQNYFATSRQARYSVLFAFPLLILYEGLSALLSGSAVAGVRNGADVLLKTVFLSLGGRWGLLVFGVLFLGIGGWIVWRDQRRRRVPLAPKLFAAMFAESLVYAALFGQTVALLTTWLLQGGPSLMTVAQSPVASLPVGTQLVVSLGAGLYEELVFRVLLVSALLWLGMRLGYGDAFTTPSFTFRAIAGLLLSGLYVARGFGIAAWTHALYDVGLALL